MTCKESSELAKILWAAASTAERAERKIAEAIESGLPGDIPRLRHEQTRVRAAFCRLTEAAEAIAKL